MTERTLSAGVAAAIAGILTDRSEITVDEAVSLLPAHIASARPSKKSVIAGIAAAGWRGVRDAGSDLVYRAPGHRSDPLQRHGEPGDNIAAEELRLLIERTELLQEEKKGLADDIKDVMAEAKGRGYDPKAIRTILAIRKKAKEEWQEEQAILDVYLQALGMI